MSSNSFNPFTPERREKFKCTLFCFRSYVEDAAFFIAIVGIFLATVFFFYYYREIDLSHNAHYYRQEAFLHLFGISAILILLNVGIIVGLITRIPGFFAPYLISLAVFTVYPSGYIFAYSAFYSFTSLDSRTSTFFNFINRGRGSNYKSIDDVDWRRFEALNGVVLIGFLLFIQIWIFSIVWRAMSAVRFEKIANQIAKDQQENRGGTFVQPPVPMMIDVMKPSGKMNNNNSNNGGHYSIA